MKRGSRTWRVELVRALQTMLNIDRSHLSRHWVLFNKSSPMADVTLGCSPSSLVDVFGFVSQAMFKFNLLVQVPLWQTVCGKNHPAARNPDWTAYPCLANITKPKTSTIDDDEQPKVTSAFSEHLLNNTKCLDKYDRPMSSIVCRAWTSSTLHVLDPLFIKKLKPELCKQMEFVKCLDLFPT